MVTTELPRLIPTGTCWCGCGKQVGIGSFFAPGHDKVAEGALLAARYGGSVAQLLHGHGYGPGHSVTAAAVSESTWEQCPGRQCDYVGTPISVRSHQRRAGH